MQVKAGKKRSYIEPKLIASGTIGEVTLAAQCGSTLDDAAFDGGTFDPDAICRS